MGELAPWHWALILLAFVVLFGYKRLPDATRSLGRSLRILKAETRGLGGSGHSDPATRHEDESPAA